MTQSKRKGVLLAGGKGSRLFPITKSISKQILPVYDKPMVYYPLSILMLADITDILLISSEEALEDYKSLLGNGLQFGINISYKIQKEPKGIAEALILAESFLRDAPCTLILGDNIFYGADLSKKLIKASKEQEGLTIFCFPVEDPHRFGVAEVDSDLNVISIEEKPSDPKSNLAVTGLYFYDSLASKYAKDLVPSDRGELEITDLNKVYLSKKKVRAESLLRGNSWFDTGTVDSLFEASSFIRGVQKNQGLQIGCLEEIALSKGLIDKKHLRKLIKEMGNNDYSMYLEALI